MKTYKWLRGLLKASALTSIMFVMQACYGMPHDEDMIDPYYNDTVDSLQVTTIDDISDVADEFVETETDSEVTEAE